MQERAGIVTFQGRPLTLVGPDLREGDPVPHFTLLDADLAPVRWSDLKGPRLLLNVVPSLDTSVCSAQTRRFNEEVVKLPESVAVVTVSADLPFAQARFVEAEGIRHRVLSDYRDFSFGPAFGVAIRELRLLARSVFVVDKDGRIVYREIVPEIIDPPHYESALRALLG